MELQLIAEWSLFPLYYIKHSDITIVRMLVNLILLRG